MIFPVPRLLQWYADNQRDLPWRHSLDIYTVWVSEVMLQQTQVATVIPYYLRFIQRFPTITSLALAPEQEVLKLWEGLGYYSRVRNLHRAAQEVVATFGGVIPVDPVLFRRLPGIGPYIAAAVLSIAAGIPMAAVDGNVMRVYARFCSLAEDISKNSTRDLITAELQQMIPATAAGDFTQAFMELGALVCTPKTPHCPTCPLNEECTAFQKGTVDLYPFKPARGKIPAYDVAVGIIVQNERFYIQKRPSTGHLGGLWEFPGGKAEPGETPAETLLRECREELGVTVEIVQELAVVYHAYSHFKICMRVFICGLKGQQVIQPEGHEYRWITIAQLDEYPFPGANHKFFPRLREFFHPVRSE